MARLTDDQRATVIAQGPLARHFVGKVLRRWPSIGFDEARSLCNLALCLAVAKHDHDPDRGKLSTSMGWQVRGQVSAYFESIRPAGYKNESQTGPPPGTELLPIDAALTLTGRGYHR